MPHPNTLCSAAKNKTTHPMHRRKSLKNNFNNNKHINKTINKK